MLPSGANRSMSLTRALRTGPDRAGHLCGEHRSQAGQAPLHRLHVDDVGLRESPVRLGARGVVELDDHDGCAHTTLAAAQRRRGRGNGLRLRGRGRGRGRRRGRRLRCLRGPLLGAARREHQSETDHGSDSTHGLRVVVRHAGARSATQWIRPLFIAAQGCRRPRTWAGPRLEGPATALSIVATTAQAKDRTRAGPRRPSRTSGGAGHCPPAGTAAPAGPGAAGALPGRRR